MTTSCLRCKKPLRDPESVRAGMGPVCRSRTASADEGGDMPLFAPREAYAGEVVRIWRDLQGVVQASVPLSVVQHSPTGWETGYAGSGPADLALNILNALAPTCAGERVHCFRGSCSATAWNLHQAFKRRFLVSAVLSKGEERVYRTDALRGWIMAQNGGLET